MIHLGKFIDINLEGGERSKSTREGEKEEG